MGRRARRLDTPTPAPSRSAWFIRMVSTAWCFGVVEMKWPASAYARDQLPERILQFGSGMLLRALCVAAVDTANRAGARAGRIVVVQSTAEGASRTRAMNAQDGLFTWIERGLSGGAPLERTSVIGAISRAVAADSEWNVVRDVAANPAIQVIVSNVSEAGFRIDAPFPGRLADVLHARYTRAPDARPVFVIPTELVPDNGPRLAGVRPVRAATRHPLLGPFMKRLLFDEIIPATEIPADDARAFANQVLERFANPWLEHEWRVIATNQEEKFRIRVVPLIVRRPAPGLSLAAAAHLTFTRASLETLGEAARIPEFVTTTERWMAILARDGALAAVRDSLKRPP